jgi:hypothetical protein
MATTSNIHLRISLTGSTDGAASTSSFIGAPQGRNQHGQGRAYRVASDMGNGFDG